MMPLKPEMEGYSTAVQPVTRAAATTPLAQVTELLRQEKETRCSRHPIYLTAIPLEDSIHTLFPCKL